MEILIEVVIREPRSPGGHRVGVPALLGSASDGERTGEIKETIRPLGEGGRPAD